MQPAIHVDSVHHAGETTVVTGWSTLGNAFCREFPDFAALTFRRPDVAKVHPLAPPQEWGFVVVLKGAPPPPVLGPGTTGMNLSLDGVGSGRLSLWQHLRCAHPEDRTRVREWVVARLPRDVLPGWAEQVDLSRAFPQVLAHVDQSLLVMGEVLVLSGWMADPESQVTAALLVVDGAVVADLAESWVRFPRPDVVRAPQVGASLSSTHVGFKAVVPLHERGSQAASLVLCTASGRSQVLELALRPSGVVAGLEWLFEAMEPAVRAGDTRSCEQLVTWGETLWQQSLARLERRPVQVKRYGLPPERPTCSVIVPLYGRADFLLHQLVAFSQDPSMGGVEFLYVNDDPGLSAELEQLGREAASLGVPPFSVIDAGGNRGYSAANNLGASHARSELLLLLNSDVMPRSHGWLQQLVSAYRSVSDVGALGARLVYEDGLLQHAGMVQRELDAYPGLRWNIHPGRGLPEHLVPGRGLWPADLVTGACLLVSAEKYRSVGGLDAGRYIIGDFEDSDLCMKLGAAGWRNYLLDDVSLIHLERQSQAFATQGAFRFNLTLANAYQYVRRWGAATPGRDAATQGVK